MASSIAASGISIIKDAPVSSNTQGPRPKVPEMRTSASRSSITPATSSEPDYGEGVRRVQLHEYKAAAACLADAFAEDDVAQYFIDTPDRSHWTKQQKWDLHVQIMEFITYAHLLRGLVLTTGEDWGSVALWMPPGQNMDDWLTILRSGMWRLQFLLSREGRQRFFNEFLPLLHNAKAEVMNTRDDDSYYLVYIGTRPHGRGKGWARRCVTAVTRIADREGKACYLESSNAKNPALYRKWGFETKQQIALRRGEKEIGMEVMVREPVVGVGAE